MTKAEPGRLSRNIVAHGPLTVNGRRFLFLDRASSSQGEPMQPTLRDDVQLTYHSFFSLNLTTW